MIGEFHFLRPWAFLAIVPVILLLLLIRRRQDAGRAWRGIVAPHLLPYLLSGESQRTRSMPLTLLAIGWMISIFALAGPTWRREPSPFADDIAALAIVLKVTPSMRAQDIQPDRLTRSVQKIQDLLVLRRGAKASLIAYSGSAHVVMPLTMDENIVNTFARSLDPKIMPSDGDAAAEALRFADQTLTTGTGTGSIVWIADNVAPEEESSLAAWRKSSRTALRLLMPLAEGPEMAALREAAKVAGASPVKLTADNADVDQLARSTKFSSVVAAEKSDRWEESGYWLALILALLMLPFSRRGWMVSTAARS
jgi:Ca-activated chloride channel family protein